MYTLRLTTAKNQVIQHSHHEPSYLFKLAGDYSDCRAWAIMRAGSLVKKYVNDSHLPAMLRVQSD